MGLKFQGQQSDVSTANSKIGVLLLNLGSPDRPVCPSLRRYLSEFLMDPRVIELPKLLRAILVKGIIINVRSHKSAAAYRKIWSEQGSPLIANCLALGEKVANQLGPDYQVEVAMRYGQPSIGDALARLHDAGIRRVVALPLYPQYSGSTNGSTFDAIGSALKKRRWVPHLRFISDYHQHPDYIAAVGESIKRHWESQGRGQKLLMSFHGVPYKFIEQGDPYLEQCQHSANLIAKYLQLKQDEWQLVFQSRLGAQEWLQPYCDKTLAELPEQGVRSVDIVCPGFSADCLETLEEIQQENGEIFSHAGGGRYQYIPCLNDQQSHVDLIANLVRQGDT